MSRWRIRKAEPGEETMLADLEALAFGAKSWGADSVMASFVAPRVTILIGEKPGKAPAGFALWRDLGPEAELLTIGVAPATQARGLGAALVAAVVDAARAAGARRLFLEVGAENRAARRLYERAGFMEISVRRGYYRDGEDAVVMALDL